MTFCQENETTDCDLLQTIYVVILDVVIYVVILDFVIY